MISSFSEGDVKQLWLQLRKDEPDLLSNFEEFLVRIFSQLQEADNEKNKLECALKKLVLLSKSIYNAELAEVSFSFPVNRFC